MTPSDFRNMCRLDEYQSTTASKCPGYVQANLLIMEKEYALDFVIFCQRNPKPCPLLEILEPGVAEAVKLAPGSDIRTDLPMYRIFKNGKLVDEVPNIKHVWKDDMVAFLLGCSFSFEGELLKAGLAIRHIEEKKNVPMYSTNIELNDAGVFKQGKMVVSMRPFSLPDAIQAIEISSRFPQVHGSPVHIGNPEKIGIDDINSPQWGDAVPIMDHEVPLFWACGVTSQALVTNPRDCAEVYRFPSIVISHSPGSMFITDVLNEDLRKMM